MNTSATVRVLRLLKKLKLAYNPSRCGDCDLCELYTDMMTEESCYKCVVTTNVVDTEKKHYTCPIIGEIPDKHGRLIDADVFWKRLQKQTLLLWTEKSKEYQYFLDVMDMIKSAPAVLEATE